MQRLVLASSNTGKLGEFALLLAPLGREVVTQGALGITDAEEPHVTFIENALAKARHASRASGLPALADDSGLCVAALAGEPGVHSARFAQDELGEDAWAAMSREVRDARNNARLIRSLAGTAERRAHYTCVIALVRHADDPEPLVVEGRWAGEIIDSPRGTNGFGYDPYFLLPALGRTAAELAPQDKNTISHRGIALARLIERLHTDADAR